MVQFGVHLVQLLTLLFIINIHFYERNDETFWGTSNLHLFGLPRVCSKLTNSREPWAPHPQYSTECLCVFIITNVCAQYVVVLINKYAKI